MELKGVSAKKDCSYNHSCNVLVMYVFSEPMLLANMYDY